MKKSSKEFRLLQRNRILKNKPWLKSTGAKTARGKERSKMNALKMNLELHQLLKEAKGLFKQQRELHKTIIKA